MIELVGAGKTFGNGKGVFDVSLRLESGLTGFLGRNGSGKTTTMRLIMGLLAPDRGTVLIDGRDLWQYDHIYTLKRELGVPAQRRLLLHAAHRPREPGVPEPPEDRPSAMPARRWTGSSPSWRWTPSSTIRSTATPLG